jgi:hypothetical protein
MTVPKAVEAQGDGIAETEAKVPDGQAEGETTHAPQRSPQQSEANAAGRGEMENLENPWHEQSGDKGRSEQPRSHALDDPVNLPRPALDSTEGDEVAGGGEAAQPMKDDAQKRIRTHAHLGDLERAGTVAQPS